MRAALHRNGDPVRNVAVFAVHASFAVLAIAVLVAAGQPVFTDDLWWHLSAGAAYAEAGPWLEADPLLFGAAGPPSPSSWLADVFFAAVDASAGLTGLRVLHAGLVALVLGLAWSLFRRASASAWVASLATSGFAILGAYRFVQLRPHLFSILGALLVYRLLVEEERRPGSGRIILAAGLVWVWVNLHGGFLLAPLLLGSACASLAVAAALGGVEDRARERGRLVWLGAALALVLGASFLNPAGAEPHIAYLVSGGETPELGLVIDEWKSFGFLTKPLPTLPPTPLAWALGWGLVALTVVGVGRAVRQRSGALAVARGVSIDPALVGVAVASLVAMSIAVRFEWLGIFPLLLGIQAFRSVSLGGAVAARAPVALAAAVAVAGVPLFFWAGPWPMISQGLDRSWETYRRAYPAAKYYGHSIGWLADAGLEGHLFTEYSLGGFSGYWLAPALRTTLNGSLNVPTETLEASAALGMRQGLAEDESFLELLDRQRVDVFLGTKLPRVPPPNRPWIYTTAHLENQPGWLPVFRNIRSAVYLRTNERNRENLERVAAYYEREGVPFDPVRGFDVEQVQRAAPEWAFRHAVVPMHTRALQFATGSHLPTERRPALAKLATIYAVLGLYEGAARLDRQLLRSDPSEGSARRRLVWSLLHLGRFEEADREAEALRTGKGRAGLDGAVAATARAAAEAPDPAEAARLVAHLPLLTAAEAKQLEYGFRVSEPRIQP